MQCRWITGLGHCKKNNPAERRGVEDRIQKHNWGIRLVMQAVAVGGQQKSKSNLASLQAYAYFPMLLFSIRACTNRWCAVFPVSRAPRQRWIISPPPVVWIPHFHTRAGVGWPRWWEGRCSTLGSLWEGVHSCCSVGTWLFWIALGRRWTHILTFQSFKTRRGINLKFMRISNTSGRLSGQIWPTLLRKNCLQKVNFPIYMIIRLIFTVGSFYIISTWMCYFHCNILQ